MAPTDRTMIARGRGAMSPRRHLSDVTFESPWSLFLMVAATALFLLILVGYPVIYAVVMSLQEVTVANMHTLERPWVGLANYQRLLADPLLPIVLRNTAVFVGFNVILQCVGGLAAALFFQQRFPGADFLRGLILAGWMLPPLVIAAVWKWLLASDNGIMNFALQGLGLIAGPVYWLSDPDTSLIAVTMANVWFGLPFNMILITAGLTGIPRELYEAAALDGAGPVRRFLSITLPLLSPTLYALLALSTIYTLRAFDLIWTMTHGGPVDSSSILPVWSYHQSFDVFDFSGGAAISTLSLLVVFVVALVYVRNVRAECL